MATSVSLQAQKPNVLFVFADQWRAQATGYAGDVNARTPNLDAFAAEGVNFSNAVSATPVSSPYRASLITGQFAPSHGMLINDLSLKPSGPTMGEIFRDNGYMTGYVGKWHLFGEGRMNFIPEEERFGFDYWKVMNCTHNYNDSFYWEEEPVKKKWKGYDAFAQTESILKFIDSASKTGKPFCAVLSWGPPHSPYSTAPAEYQAMYPDPGKIVLRPNVPEEMQEQARKNLCGYYAHIAALDKAFGDIVGHLRSLGILDNTIVVFTSDHGDMLCSHSFTGKSRPYDESIRVPFLIRYPKGLSGKVMDEPITTPDILPTLLDLCRISIPSSIEGRSLYPILSGKKKTLGDGAIVCWPYPRKAYGMKEYRMVRTKQYSYVETPDGAWMLFDNYRDPYQQDNLANRPEYAKLQAGLKKKLHGLLKEAGDEFLEGKEYVKRFGIPLEKMKW